MKKLTPLQNTQFTKLAVLLLIPDFLQSSTYGMALS